MGKVNEATVGLEYRADESTGGDERPMVAGALLRPRLRIRDGVALIVSNVIGVGIFTTPSIIASLVPRPGAMILLWVVGGMLALAGATSYAELARLYPWAGGEYVYLSRIYGRAAGFLSGWTSLIAGFTGAVAASAVGLVIYLGEYVPFLASDHIFWQVPFLTGKITLSARTVTAAAIILTFALLHSFSVKAAKVTQNSLALLIAIVIAGFVGCGFAFGHGSWNNFHAAAAPVRTVNWLLALIPVMFTYSGWNAAAYVSEELQDTRTSIRRVLLLGTIIVAVLYVLLNMLYVYSVPVEQMRAAVNIGNITATALFGTAKHAVTPVLIVALLGAISAMTIAGPRVYFSMARDEVFIPVFARTNRRFGTPAFAIWLQALLAVAFVCCGQFEQILMYTGFAIVLSSGVAVAGLFWVWRRRLLHEAQLRWRMPIPASFVLASALLTANVVMQSPRAALFGILLIGAGVPVFYFTSRRGGSVEKMETAVTGGDQDLC